MAPISNPRLIVAVMLDEPAGSYYGGAVSAPVFSSVMGAALRMLGVPTDAPVNNIVLPPETATVEEDT
jgi:cell division protein FtsI (penicillin-binding protein 3)